ncbi:MAG TPA: DNA primase [Anaerolineaceae bacterium]|jgi:DNA primase
MSTIDEVKARIDIVDLVSETVKLRRTGKNYSGFCPFHTNSHTPAFAVFPDSGTWRCFGQCNEGGDIFKFIMKREGWDFPQTLKYLADKAGVQLVAPSPQAEEAAEEHERLRSLLEEAVVFYRHHLLQTPAGQIALDYLHRRQLTDQTIEVFGLGYAPDAWEAALQHFRAKGYRPEELLQAGMATQRDHNAAPGDSSGGVYDRFRNRIMFPIRDLAGKMVGFGARILNPNDTPKFLNSPQTELFDKGRLLYGLDAARKAIRAQDQVVIVEGYLDVIALHQGGFPNTVSPMGTALTEDQLRLLKRFSRRIILALDPDAAGEKATLRGLEVARQAMDHADELVFDARGLVRHEARLQADLRVTTLPDGMDPDEVVNRDPAEWSRILEAARPVVVHVMETLAAGRDLDDPKVRSEIAAQVLPLIEDVPDPVERETYRQRLARLLHVDERALIGARPPAPRAHTRRAAQPAGGSRSAPPVASSVQNPTHGKEAFCLGILLRKPELIFIIDRALQEVGLGRLSAEDFQHTDYQVIFRIVQESTDQDEQEPALYVPAAMPEPLTEVASQLVTGAGPDEPNQDRLVEALMRNILFLRDHYLKESLNQLRFLEEESQDQGDLRAIPYREMVNQQALIRRVLNQASVTRSTKK